MPFLPADPVQQKKILIGVIPLLLAVAYGYLVHGDLRASVRTLEVRLQRLQAQNEQARALKGEGSAGLHRRVQRYEQQLARLEELIPADEDVPALLHAVTVSAQETAVELRRLVPEEVVTEETASEDAYYHLQTFYLNVAGGYHDIARFLTAIGSLPRIVTSRDVRMTEANPDDPSLTRSGARRLAAELRIQTYVLPSSAPTEKP